MEREVVLVDCSRSAFTKLGGALRKLSSAELAAFVIKGLVKKTGITERGAVDTVIAGCALGDIGAYSPARYASLQAGLPWETSAVFVEMQCGSAVTSLNHAAFRILSGQSDVVIVGGMESYSTLPAKFSTSAEPYKNLPPKAQPLSLTPNKERDTDMIFNNDLMAKTWKVDRRECDEFAVESQKRLANAYATGLIGPEIVPYTIPATKKDPEIIVDKDDHPRPDTSYDTIAKMRSVYEGGVTTAANASGRNDGACFLLVMSAEKAKEYGYKPYAKWIGCAHKGCDENLMGIGASYAGVEALNRLKLRLCDIDVFECNEAFAAQNLCVIKDMEEKTGEKIDRVKWNPNGGAIAIGHPNGASGARITWFAIKQLEKTGGKYGLVSVCCGGGQGTAAVLENLRC